MPLAGSHLKGNLDAFCVIDTDNSLPASQHIVQLGLVSGSRESIFGFLKARFRLVKAKMQQTKPGLASTHFRFWQGNNTLLSRKGNVAPEPLRFRAVACLEYPIFPSTGADKVKGQRCLQSGH